MASALSPSRRAFSRLRWSPPFRPKCGFLSPEARHSRSAQATRRNTPLSSAISWKTACLTAKSSVSMALCAWRRADFALGEKRKKEEESMEATDPIIIAGAARTAIDGFLGDFRDLAAHQLGAAAIHAAIRRAAIPPDSVEEVLMGCVLPAGQGQAPARQAALGAGLPPSAGAVTINKMCGSGMKAAMLAHDMLVAGSARILVAGGMESMSNAPYLLERARTGYRMGQGRLLDHMFLDGLEDANDKGRLMGAFAEDCAQAYKFTREEQDE